MLADFYWRASYNYCSHVVTQSLFCVRGYSDFCRDIVTRRARVISALYFRTEGTEYREYLCTGARRFNSEVLVRTAEVT